ncbi:N-6 DNA methylase, partial [Paraclostridium sordellii]|uniref:N-6 DNA methylase n=1 Tax=Paraclostridium sordellii TaxID=1505 RepID=UPI000708FB06
PWKPLAKLILISWINKLTFAHVLKKYNQDAYLVDNIKGDLSIEDGLDYINQIAIKCNYRNIFKLQIGENYLPKLTWSDIKRINELLIDSRLENISNDTMQIIISNVVKRSTRRIYGQFTTPRELATLIATLTITDKTKNTLDPCCGTGTIPKACYEWKVYSGIEKHDALETTWASDKLNFPLQLAMMSLTEPGVIGDVVKVFNQDATMIEPGTIANMQDTKNGKPVKYEIPRMGYILSNLPFVQQEDIDKINSGTKLRINEKISDIIGSDDKLDGRSDLYGYLPFALYDELEDNGKMTIIISNAWLASKWGDQFYNLLSQFYNIESIVTSGKGRWFSNADVVTNILVLTKTTDRNNRTTKYIVLNESLNDLVNTDNKVDYEKLNELTSKMRTNVEDDRITSTEYTHEEIKNLLNLGISKNAFFGDVKWINKIEDKLIKANSLFDIGRGERRGWDAMFYPEEGHEIESEYIKPVLKSSRDINGYVAEAESEAFCCNETITNLSINSKNGALQWIKSFENQTNKTGKALPDVLKRTGINWYTMLPNTMADICISINPGDRLFYARLKEPAFVNQRLTRFVRIDNNTDIKLCTALLNSVLGLFFIEALGFGRGLGALDLSATKLKENLLMLNPELISDKDKVDILDKYNLLENRKVLNIKDELISEDRQAFDKAVLSAFGIEEYEADIKNALITLFNIRKAATE